MSNVQRYVEGSRNTLLINVLSAVTVQTGDLMFIDKINNLRVNGSSTANNYGYPAEYLRTSGSSLEINKETFKTYFLGVALDYKDGISGGVDLNIPVATSGKFNFDLKPARSIFTGDMFGASGTSTASDLFNQKIMKVTDENKALGYFAETKIGAIEADITINTAYSSKGLV